MPPELKTEDEPEIRVVEDTGTSSKEDKPDAGQHFQRDDRTPRQEVERKPARERERSNDNRFADDDDGEMGPRVQKRLNQFRRRTGDAEARATALTEENRRLLAQVQETSAAAMSHYEAAANARLDAAKREHLEAYESGDGLKVVEASRKLSSAQNALDNVEAVKARQKQEAARPAAQQPVAQRATYSTRTQDWIDDHPWFERDQAAKDDAIRIHDRMVKQGYTPDTPEYFKELTARCRTMFPEHFSDDDVIVSDDDDEPLPKPRAERRAEEQARRAPPVAGVSRTTSTGRKVTEVKLTPAMIEAAQIAGVHPKKYAEQMIALRKEGKL